ncbi:hypothetical protein [Macrococcus armenti]|uniref:hypothetical protein n=1 Tax=Macrococcus armenti TaxID=2875764 RepID=UPI001CC9DED8|nr:hypothetical protein [Macrococcus armenti]UBH08923.1 hypothetical protein LAU41_01745 [Macrococcus armenti]UBH11215.1 hypothetical protein LAU38_01720 [Macrococcus armenti]UBH15691.1 hypothetical protein LAU44_01690 [Macrococcus armenti]UBH18051.1 hypothetical protein LAU39_01695 [Macrococcus armenti]UBH20317.1 hypothetical protein LAU40_01690 [Macrococcus armenti]
MFVKTYFPSSYVKYLFEVKGRIALDNFDEAQFKRLYSGYLFHFDIKNFSGHYAFINNNFVSERNYVIKDHIALFNGAHIKLKQFCMKNNPDYKILSYVVFINSDFAVTGFNGHSHILFKVILL